MGMQMETWYRWSQVSFGATTASLGAQHAHYIDLGKKAGYCIHLNKKAESLHTYKHGGLMVYSRVKTTGLANFNKSNLCRGNSLQAVSM